MAMFTLENFVESRDICAGSAALSTCLHQELTKQSPIGVEVASFIGSLWTDFGPELTKRCLDKNEPMFVFLFHSLIITRRLNRLDSSIMYARCDFNSNGNANW